MIAIIGGGITGLAAAYELTRRQVPFVLFEASTRLGGLIKTEHVDGFTIEAGPDSVLAQKRAALDLFEELGLSASVIATRQPRAAFVLKRGHLYRLPSPSILGIPTTLTGVLQYRLLPPPARARLSFEPFVRVSRRHDESVGSFFRRRFGAATVDLVAEPLLGGIHAGNVEALSVQSLFPRLVAAEVSRKSVLHAFRGAGSPGDGLFRSLAGGMGTLVESIQRRLPAGSVRPGAPVRAVERSPSGWCVRPDGARVDATAVIVAAPARAAAQMLAGVDDRVAELCGQVPYVSSASIALAWRREQVRHPLAGSGFVVARRHNDLRITACTWVSSKWEGRAPDGMVLLRAFVGGAHDPGAIDLDDPALVDVAVRDLRRVLEVDGPPALARVHRWRDAGAQHNVGQLARMTEIESRLARRPGLVVAGSGFRSTGIPDCIADGRAAAAAAERWERGGTYATIGPL